MAYQGQRHFSSAIGTISSVDKKRKAPLPYLFAPATLGENKRSRPPQRSAIANMHNAWAGLSGRARVPCTVKKSMCDARLARISTD